MHPRGLVVIKKLHNIYYVNHRPYSGVAFSVLANVLLSN